MRLTDNKTMRLTDNESGAKVQALLWSEYEKSKHNDIA
jgi:shikimate kinase